MTNGSSRSEVKKQMFFPFLICSRITTAEITTKMDYVMNCILLKIKDRISYQLCGLKIFSEREGIINIDDSDDDYP